MNIGRRHIEAERFLGTPEEPEARLIEDYAIAVDRSRPLGQRIRAFLSGQNRAGRITGSILDAATLLLPFGRQIQTGREAASLIIQRKQQPPMKEVINRALGTGGGGFIKVRNEEGEIDATAIAASVIRFAIIIGGLYLADRLGVLEPVTTFIGL